MVGAEHVPGVISVGQSVGAEHDVAKSSATHLPHEDDGAGGGVGSGVGEGVDWACQT